MFAVFHLPSIFPGCAPINNVSFAWAYWLPMTLFESVLFLLSAVKAIQYVFNSEIRTQTPNLAFILVRDSIIYFGSVVALIIVNLVIWVIGRVRIFIITPNLSRSMEPDITSSLPCLPYSSCKYFSTIQQLLPVASPP